MRRIGGEERGAREKQGEGKRERQIRKGKGKGKKPKSSEKKVVAGFWIPQVRLLDLSPRAGISVLGRGRLSAVSVLRLSADHVCSENEKCQNASEAFLFPGFDFHD